MSDYIERYWRDATLEDAIKDPPMACRMRFDESGDWYDAGHLMGCDRSSEEKWITNEWLDRQCQVYDAPDPGEGYELIDTTKTTKQVGDEYLSHDGTWRKAATEFGFRDGNIYRRRIEQPKPKYVPFTWEDREQLRGRWIYRTKDGNIIEEIAFKFDSRVFNAVAKHLLEDGWKFLDTGKPVGKEVVQ